MMKDLNAPAPPQPRKRKVIPGLEEDEDEADSHPPPPQCKIIRITSPKATTVPEADAPQAPPKQPTPPRASTPPAAEPSLNDNFAPPPQVQPSPPRGDASAPVAPETNEPVAPEANAPVAPEARAEANPAASKDYSFAKSDDAEDSDDEEDDMDSADKDDPDADDEELAIINPSQERAIVATREAAVPHISPARRMNTRQHRPIQDTQLDSRYPRETFPIYTGPVRHGPEFDLEVHRQKLRFFAVSPYSSARTADDLRFWTAEQQILYTKLYCQKGVLFRHKYLDLRSLSSATCFQNIVH